MLIDGIRIAANLALFILLLVWGMAALSDYFARGQWTKNVTKLLSGAGLLLLAVRCSLSPTMMALLLWTSHTRVPAALVVVSSLLLLAAICAFGMITYWRPLRLWRERQVAQQRRAGLNQIP